MTRRAASALLSDYASGQREFTGCDLRGQRLSGQSLDGLVLRDADLRGTDLSGAHLRKARFTECRMGPGVVSSALRASAHVLFGLLSGFILFFSCTFVVAFIIAQRPGIPSYTVVLASLWLLYLLVSVYQTGLTPFSGVMSAAFSLLSAGAGAAVGLLSVFEGLASAGIVILAIAGLHSGSIVLVALLSLLILMPVTMLCISATLGQAALIGAAVAASLGLLQLSVHKLLIAGLMALIWLIAASISRRVSAEDPRFYWLYHLAARLQALGGTRLTGSDLTDADLGNLSLAGVDFSGAKLHRVVFRATRHIERALFHGTLLQSTTVRRLVVTGSGDGLQLQGADLSGISVRHATLHGAQLSACLLTGADLQHADLTDANLAEADLEGALLIGANLGRTDLRGASLRGADLSQAAISEALWTGAVIDYETCRKSALNVEAVESLRERGALLYNLNEFPEGQRSRLAGVEEGLTLYFNTRLTPFSRHMIDGVVYALFGPDAPCEVSYFINREDSALVRLSGPRDALELIAESLYRKLWEVAAQDSEQALVQRVQAMLSVTLRAALSDLFDQRLVRIELRQHQPAGCATDIPPSTEPGRAKLAWTWNHSVDTIKTTCQLQVAIVSARSPADQGLKERLLKHCSVIEKQGLAAFRSMQDALAGDDVASFWSSQIARSSIVLVLVSPDLFASEECGQQISQVLREPAARARIIPILLRPSDWRNSSLCAWKALPDNETPIACWKNQDAALLDTVSGVRRVLLGLL